MTSKLIKIFYLSQKINFLFFLIFPEFFEFFRFFFFRSNRSPSIDHGRSHPIDLTYRSPSIAHRSITIDLSDRSRSITIDRSLRSISIDRPSIEHDRSPLMDRRRSMTVDRPPSINHDRSIAIAVHRSSSIDHDRSIDGDRDRSAGENFSRSTRLSPPPPSPPASHAGGSSAGWNAPPPPRFHAGGSSAGWNCPPPPSPRFTREEIPQPQEEGGEGTCEGTHVSRRLRLTPPQGETGKEPAASHAGEKKEERGKGGSFLGRKGEERRKGEGGVIGGPPNGRSVDRAPILLSKLGNGGPHAKKNKTIFFFFLL